MANKVIDWIDYTSECESCEVIKSTDEISGVRFRDCDGYMRELWLCENCIEQQIWI